MIAPPVLPSDWAALSERFGIADAGSAIVKLSGEAHAVAEQSKAASNLDRGLRVGPVPVGRADEWGQAMRLGFGDDDPRRAQQSAPSLHNPSLRNQLRAGLTTRYQRENWIWRGSATQH
jgi:hypothetical protein